MTQITPLLKEIYEINTAIAKAEDNLLTLRQRRQWLNAQISEYLLAENECAAIGKRFEKMREALTL